MGYFQAKKTKDDQPVTFSDGLITDTPSDTTPSIQAYYDAILNAVHLGFTKGTPKSNTTEDGTFENNAKNLWGIGHDESLPDPFGYFTNEDNKDVIMDRIAEEENKYYWQWMDRREANDVKEAKNSEGEVILNQFRIVNTRLIDRMFINSDKVFSNHTIWKNEKGYDNHGLTLKHQGLQDDIVPSILVSPSGVVYLKTETDADSEADANPKPKLLFLDEAERTQRFCYEYEKVSGDYKEQLTWNYDPVQEYAYGNRIGNKEHKITPYSGHYNQEDLDQLRYSEAYKRAYNAYATEYNKAYEPKDEGRLTAVGLTDIYKLTNIENHDNIKQIKDKLGEAIYEQKKDEFKEIAERAAQELPRTTHCFYYDDNNELKGFISAVSIREGGKGGGSGYQMRADKVDEVHYQFIQQGTNDDYLDFLVRYRLFGLENENVRIQTPTIKNDRNTNGNSYYPTNWPYDKNFIATKIEQIKTENGGLEDHPMTGLTTNSRFWYYKNFKSGAARRNEPQKDPFPPRLTNNQVGHYHYLYKLKYVTGNTNNSEKYVKLDRKSYRKWKKVNHDNKPLQLGRNDNPRIDAGTAMAEALRGFSIHEAMIKQSNLTPKVSSSKLPATAFVKYVLGNDDDAKAQWRKDNSMIENATVNAQSLKTDQEWCHLYGHGDGGTEDLSNFVAGSKHCNTEQLAIEVGQRRVTQADFFKDEAKNITAKITAYLLPNQGTWLTKGTYSATVLEEKLGGFWDGHENNNYTNWWDQFFSLVNNKYELRPPQDCTTAFESLSEKITSLSEEIRKKNNNEEKKSLLELKAHLLKFRHSIETRFFMYLPIARWMRYKIYYKNTKVFDHIYDAQSESTNVHECQILDDTVERVLYKAIIDHYESTAEPKAKRARKQ